MYKMQIERHDKMEVEKKKLKITGRIDSPQQAERGAFGAYSSVKVNYYQ